MATDRIKKCPTLRIYRVSMLVERRLRFFTVFARTPRPSRANTRSFEATLKTQLLSMTMIVIEDGTIGDSKNNPIFMTHLFEIYFKYYYSFTHEEQGPLYGAGLGEAPPKPQQRRWPVSRIHPGYTENTSYSATVWACQQQQQVKRGKGKPGYGPHPKIEPIFYVYIYRSLVYTQL